jgi:hypothetical protein
LIIWICNTTIAIPQVQSQVSPQGRTTNQGFLGGMRLLATMKVGFFRPIRKRRGLTPFAALTFWFNQGVGRCQTSQGDKRIHQLKRFFLSRVNHAELLFRDPLRSLIAVFEDDKAGFGFFDEKLDLVTIHTGHFDESSYDEYIVCPTQRSGECSVPAAKREARFSHPILPERDHDFATVSLHFVLRPLSVELTLFAHLSWVL